MLARYRKANARVSVSRPRVMLEHFKLDDVDSVPLEAIEHHEPRCLGPVAKSPAILFANDDPEIGCSRIHARKVSERRGADQTSRFPLVNGIGHIPGGRRHDDRLEIATRLNIIEGALIVTQHPSNLDVAIPALKRRKI